MLHIFATLYEKKYTKALATAPFENILFQNQSIKQTKYSEKQRRHPEKHLEKVSLTVSIIYFILLIMIKNWSKLQKFKSCTFVQICFKILGSCNLLQRNRSKQVKQKNIASEFNQMKIILHFGTKGFWIYFEKPPKEH